MSFIRDLVESTGGQRFFMAMGAGVVNTGLLIGGYVSDTVYRDLTLGTVGVFIGALTVQKIADMKTARAAGVTYEENEGV